MITKTGQALSGWIPYRLQHDASARWAYMGDIPFTDPFFYDTLQKSKQLKENCSFFSCTASTDCLQEWSKEIDAVQPSAFIFHVSRCGSTLLAQLLGLDEQHIVLAETPFIDELLRTKYKPGGKDMSYMLPSAIPFYGQKRNGRENRLFIKTDSWHLFFYEALRALYPAIPFILLYRQPDEVIASQAKLKGQHAVEGVIEKEIFSLGELPPYHHNPDYYMAAVLEQYYTAMYQICQKDAHAHLMNYNEGFVHLTEKVYALTNTELSEQRKSSFEERCGYDAKAPGEKFNLAPSAAQEIPGYMSKAFELYDQLDALRLAGV